MGKTALDVVVRHVRRAAAGLHGEERTDPELLRQFAHGGDEGAFAALVRRHGPMVMRVCRHVLRREQDAEDAFQVTFLVLARNPTAVRKGASLASWFHGVAYRTALTARRRAATRQRHEARAATMTPADVPQELAWREVQAILDEEVQALPEAYRAPFVLCQMEGRSRSDAARELGIKEGTVSSRLGRAQKRLRERLVGRGVSLSAVLGALALATADGVAAVPRRLVDATIRARVAHTAGAISAGAEDLLRAVTKGLGVTRWKVATALLATVLVVTGGSTVPARLAGQQKGEAAAPDRPQPAAPKKSPAAAPAAPGKVAEEVVTVSGRVVGPDGKPFAGAEVSVRWSHIGVEPVRPRVKTTSGPDGRFRLHFRRSEVGKPSLPPDIDPYHFSPLEVVASARGYGPGWAVVHVQRGSKGEGLTLRLVKDDIPITGRVRDVQLRPVTDATVRVLWGRDDGRLSDPWPGLAKGVPTDKEGRFVLRGIGRGRAARLAVEGPTIERKIVEVSTAKASAATIDLIARPTRVVEGTVRAEDTGKPLAGVVIRGGQQQGLFTGLYTLTDEKGRYRLVGLPKGGSYEVTAWPNRGQPYIPRTATVGDSRGLRPITVDFRLRRGVPIRVRLIDKGTGKPVRGIVHYDPLASNPARPSLERNGSIGGTLWQFRTSFPDKDGYVHFVVPPGPGLVMGQGHDIPYLTRPLDPADEKDYPVLKKTPLLLGGLFHYWELFHSYRVFDVKAGAKRLDVEIELDPGCKAEGKLVGPDSRPVSGALAYGLTHQPQNVNNVSYRDDPIYRAGLESRTLETDRFVTAGLKPDGARTVTFLHAGRKLIANVTVRADHKGPLTVRLEPWGSVTGRVVDQNGKPVAGLGVGMLYPSQDGPALLTPGKGGVAAGLLPVGWPFRTDAEGRFRVEGLIPGKKHRLTFPAGVVKEVSAKAGEVRDLGDVRVNVKPEKGGKR